ncbi:MAG: hypothetical protein ABSA09_11185 [Desulfobaccales bacterium]
MKRLAKMKLPLLSVLAALVVLLLVGLAPSPGNANTFILTGNYLDVGISNSGGLINDTPGGPYYAATGSTGIRYAPAGNGIYTAVDFLTPGSPLEFYSIGVNGINLGSAGYWDGNTFGMNTTNVSTGSVQSSASFSFAGASTLLLIQTVHFLNNSKDISFTIEMQNLGGSTLNNIVYARGLDPDPDFIPYGNYSTNNSIAGGVVTAVGPRTNYSIAIQNVGKIAGVPSITDWDQNPYDLLLPTNLGNGDYTIDMAWDIGTLLPGQSAEVDFQYNINGPVPLPPTVLLLGSGLFSLAFLGRRRKKV